MCAPESRIAVDHGRVSHADEIQRTQALAIGGVRLALAWEAVIRNRRVLRPIVFGKVT